MNKLFLFLFLLFRLSLSAQTMGQHVVDSLIKELPKQKEDTNKVKLLNKLSYNLLRIKPDEAFLYGNEALKLSEKLQYNKGKGIALINIGTMFEYQSNYEEALKNNFAALRLAEKLNFKDEMATSYTNIGQIYFKQGHYPEGLKICDSAIEIAKAIGSKQFLSNALNSLGNIQSSQGNFQAALQTYFYSLSIRNEINDKTGIAQSYNNIGDMWMATGNYSEALKNFYSSLKIAEQTGDKRRMASIHGDIGSVMYQQGNYGDALNNHLIALKLGQELDAKRLVAYAYEHIGDIYAKQSNFTEAINNHLAALKIGVTIKEREIIATAYIKIGNVWALQGHYADALNNYDSAMSISKEMGQKSLISSSYGNIANVHYRLGKYAEAEKFIKSSLQIAKEIGALEEIKMADELLSKIYEKKGQSEKSLAYYKAFISVKDSLTNINSTKKSMLVQLQYDFDKKDALARINQDMKDSQTKLQIRRGKIKLYAALGGVGLLLIIALLAAYGYRLKQKTNKNLEQSFKNIEVITKMGIKITATLNLSEAINIIHEYLNTVMDATGFSIYIFNHDNKCLELKYAVYSDKHFNKTTITIDSNDSFAVWCVTNYKEVVINDVENEYSLYLKNYCWANENHEKPDKQRINSLIIVPLGVKNEVIGCVSIQSFQKSAYTKYHLEIFKSLSLYIAVALSNSEAYMQLNTANKTITNLVADREKTIDLRTAELRIANQKLVELIQYNAHNIREPLTRIMGVMSMREYVTTDEFMEQYWDMMSKSVADLDERIKQVITELEETTGR